MDKVIPTNTIAWRVLLSFVPPSSSFFFYLNPPANVTCSLEINTIQNVSNHCFKSGNKVPSRRWFSSPFFCLLNIYANANCLSFDFIEHTLVPKQNLNEINVSVFFNHGNKVPSRRWFSSPFFCLFNTYANANCLSFDFIEHTLVPKQNLNEINVSVFFQPWEQGALQALVLVALFLPF